jgi:uncharacterized protein DUF732
MKKLAAALIIPAALLFAGNANADEDTYLDALRNHGLPVTEISVRLGHLICGAIAADGASAITSEATMGLRAGLSPHSVAMLIYDAVSELCPSQMPTLLAWADDAAGTRA